MLTVIGHNVSAPVVQLCSAYSLTQYLREHENIENLKKHYKEMRPFCNQVLAKVTTAAKSYTDVVTHFDNTK